DLGLLRRSGVGRSPDFARVARPSFAWIPAYARTTDVRRARLLRRSGIGRSPDFARVARLSLAWIPAYAGTTDVGACQTQSQHTGRKNDPAQDRSNSKSSLPNVRSTRLSAPRIASASSRFVFCSVNTFSSIVSRAMSRYANTRFF